MSFQGLWNAIKDNKTLWVQIPIAFCALCISAAALSFAIATLRQERNARLVEIGVSILKSDPTKEPATIQAREWALDLIDANAGGVKFSKEARNELLKQALPAKDLGFGDFQGGGGNFRGRGAND